MRAARDPLAALHYACCTAIVRALAQGTDQCGSQLAVVQLPVPEVEYLAVQPTEPMYQWLAELDYPADVPPFPHGRPIHVVKASSYANYLVTNGLVIAPRYGNAEKDDAAAATLEAAYPGRTVVADRPERDQLRGVAAFTAAPRSSRAAKYVTPVVARAHPEHAARAVAAPGS